MRLAALLHELERSPGAVTVADLARRLDSTPSTIAAMLAALRASGRVGPAQENRLHRDDCAQAESCVVSCAGPAQCPFTVEFGAFLEIKR